MTSDKLYIIQKAKEGDSKAMRLLYEEYYQYVLNYCHRYLMNYSLSKDLTQDIFLLVFDKIKLYKVESDFGAWLNLVCRNFIISYLREQKKNLFSSLDDYTNYGNVEEEIEEDEYTNYRNNLSVEAIYQLLEQLDEKSRTIFNLYAIDRLTHKEIAIQLGISEGTSKSQLSRARVKLKRLLDQELEKKKSVKKFNTQGLIGVVMLLITITIKKLFYE